MKLQKIHIENFGTLQNFDLDFQQGITVLEKENGWGKSTLSAFIKAMFYGLEYKPRTKLIENERKRFTPWNKQVMGGYLVFEMEGNTYRIERTFGKKVAEDTCAIFDVATNQTVDIFGENVGEAIFGVDVKSYENTAFFAGQQMDFHTTDNIFQKLSNNMLNSEESDVDHFSDAIAALDNKIKVYEKSGGRGLLNESKTKLTVALEEQKTCKANIIRYQELEERLKEKGTLLENLTETILQCENQVKEAGEYESNQQKKERLRDLEENQERLKLQLAEPYSKFKTDKEEELKEINLEITAGYTRALEVEKLEQSIQIMQSQYDVMAKAPSLEYNKEPENPSVVLEYERPTMAILLAAVGMGVISTCLAILVKQEAIFGLPVAMLILAYYIVTDRRLKKQAEKEAYEQAELRRQEEEKKHKESLEKEQQRQEELQQLLSQINESTKKAHEENQELAVLLVKYGMAQRDKENFSTALVMLVESLKGYKRLLEDYHAAKEKVEEFKEQNLKELEQQKESQNVEAVLATLREYKEKKDSLVDDIQILKLEMQRLEDAENRGKDLEDTICQLTDAISEGETKVEQLKLTQELLKEAKNRYSKRYMDKVFLYFETYAKELELEGLQVEPKMDMEMDVTVMAKGASREMDYFSAGTKDLIWICARLALVSALYEKEKPLLILDDPFVNLDGERLQKAFQLLKSFEKEYQILYLACHDSRCF